MSLSSTVDVEELRRRTRDFVRSVVLPAEPPPGQRLSPDARADLQESARAAGVFAPQVPTEFGGLGLPLRDWSPIFQEVGYSPIGAVAVNCMAPDEGNMHLLGHIATPEQQARYLAPLAAGHIRSCFAMTEPHPGAGSDPAALRTVAVKVPGGWSITGEKRFISGADGAAFAIVMARTAQTGDAPAGATMLLVDLDNPGFRVGRHIPTIDRAIGGGHPEVSLVDCVVPDDAVLGAVGQGFRYAQVRLGPARLTHCMRWLGLARRAFDTALDRADRRVLFGSKLADLGIAQELIALSEVDIETADALIGKTARLLETDGAAGTALSSVAKVHCADAISRVIDRAIQICGGDGVTDDLPLASFAAEVRPFRIYDGSTETHKWAIARRAVRRRHLAVEGGENPLDLPRRDAVGP